MSTYDVNLVGRLVLHDPPFREALLADAPRALARLELTDVERDALLAGDVAALYEGGANEYLLMNLARFGVLGLNAARFSERIRAARPRA